MGNFKKFLYVCLAVFLLQGCRTASYDKILGIQKRQSKTEALSDRLIDVWQIRLHPEYKRAYDKTCKEFAFEDKTPIRIWGTEIPLDGEFMIRYKNYGVRGQLRNGIPDGKWDYIDLDNFLYLYEEFECGYRYLSSTIFSLDVLIQIGKLFDENLNPAYVKSRSYYNKRQLKLLKFRNKLHKKIYNTQRRRASIEEKRYRKSGEEQLSDLPKPSKK